MSKAVITLEYNDKGMFDVNIDIDPAASPDMTYNDHPAAFAAMTMLNLFKNASEATKTADEAEAASGE